ncbi:hypothetical protein [Sphingomonas sp.]
MVAPKKTDADSVRKPRPTGEQFNPAEAHKQAMKIYPKVMAKLAE